MSSDAVTVVTLPRFVLNARGQQYNGKTLTTVTDPALFHLAHDTYCLVRAPFCPHRTRRTHA